jgi:hypothetical protein
MPVAALPKVALGQGGFGTVAGPTEESIREEIARTMGIRKDRIRVEKTYRKADSMKDAVKYQKVVNKIDPSRVYLRGKIMDTDKRTSKVVMPHEGKSLENIVKTPAIRKLFFESFYQLLQALVLLQHQGYVHHDIKNENITMDTRTTAGGEPIATLGLIDFDLLAKKGAHEVTHSKYPYYVYPLETFYDPVHDRFTIFDDRRHPHADPVEARRILADRYLLYLSFLRRDHRGWEAFREFLKHTQDPTHPFPSTRGLESLVEFYLLNLSTKALRKQYLKKDGNKVDTFGLGQVLYSMLHGRENEIFDGHPQKDALVPLLKTFMLWMLHPVPYLRHDAKSAMTAWMNILSLYNPSVHRRVSRQLHHPLPASSIRFTVEPSRIRRSSSNDGEGGGEEGLPLPVAGSKRKRSSEKNDKNDKMKRRSPPPPQRKSD